MAKKKKEKEEVNENNGLISKLRSVAPKGEDAGTWEIASTKDLVLSAVTHVLMSGIESFDEVTGALPIGRMVELYGLESCGKTAMAIRCAARAMDKKICEVIRNKDDTLTYRELAAHECKVLVVYIDNEQSLDEDGKLLVDGKKLDVVGCRFDTTDDMFKAIDAAIDYQEVRIEESKDDDVLRFMFIVVDTIASTTTKQELGQAWGSVDFPRQPQQISQALRQLTRRVNSSNTCILFTNQVRVKFQGQQQKSGPQTFSIQASDYSSPGGMALKYYATLRVFVYAMNQKYKLVPEAKFSAGFLIGFHTVKNRLRPPQRDGRMVLLFDKKQGGLNDDFSKLETLVFLGFIEVGSKEKHIDYTLKFKSNGIIPTTFEQSKIESTLEEDEETPVAKRGNSRKDPGFRCRSEWPQFYINHRKDIELLWDVAIIYAMACEGLEGSIQVDEVDEITTKIAED